MPRFSSQAKKIFDLIWYKMDIDESKIIFNELTNPLDRAFVKVWFAYYYFYHLKPDLGLKELKESDEINQSNPDQFNSFFIYWLYFFINVGWTFSNQMVSPEIVKQYFSKCESVYNQIEYVDEWEKHFCDGIYFMNKAFYSITRIDAYIEDEIALCKKSKESFRMMPEDGEFFSSCHGNIDLAYFQRFAGHFDESEKNFQIALQAAKKFNPFFEGASLLNLYLLNMQKGDYKKAMELNEEFYTYSMKVDNIPYIYLSLRNKGDLFYEDGKYDKALELYQESIKYRKKQNVPLEVFKGYLDIIFLYYQNFKQTKDKEFFKKAEEIFSQLKIFNDQYPDDKLITNYTKFYEARLLKYGNLNKRAKASIMFEELLKIWPYDFESVKEYLELLFEDYTISEDQETMEKIDLLMKRVIEIPLSINSIDSFVSKQIMLARYQFFIKDDIGSAFDILNEAMEKILPFKIGRFNSQLEHELMNFKNERSKWEKTDISVKERIQKSEFQKYIQEALNIKLG